MEPESLKIFTEAGAVGIAILMILYSAMKDKLYNKTLNNHLEHLHLTLTDLAVAIERGNANHDNIARTIDNNTSALTRSNDTLQQVKGIISTKH